MSVSSAVSASIYFCGVSPAAQIDLVDGDCELDESDDTQSEGEEINRVVLYVRWQLHVKSPGSVPSPPSALDIL